MKKLSKKQSQWAWFIGLYIAGFAVIFTIAQLINKVGNGRVKPALFR